MPSWFDRLQVLATQLRADPRVKVSFHFGHPIPDDTLAALEQRWGVEAFCPAIRDLYRQANGVSLLWISTHHPLYDRVKARWQKRGFSLGAFAHAPSKWTTCRLVAMH